MVLDIQSVTIIMMTLDFKGLKLWRLQKQTKGACRYLGFTHRVKIDLITVL